ncbi:pyrroline-5-carboxylate reductase [Methanoregula sp. PtaB.Bin085]|uniref:pyrroline-5-carboxylate reductase family protein n=1 Tax=Methanoregula sp. PtaB.Bin085 TaxID=1811680 RepID=UPI0009D54149|nr:NAD(P)-binding domain-containing protein [Methanoregula sp. PtaB.Bin085]OPX64817.1 MAG: pyrroline-5-carboxylate reductase [Methanoregula sp. PtaB.Bin085]
MTEKSLGFIGGGRVTMILLAALEKHSQLPSQVVVSDMNAETLKGLQQRFPSIRTVTGGNIEAAGQDIVFLALHPPAAGEVLGSIKGAVKKDATIVSLMPKVTVAQISGMLGGFLRIIRMIPNAPAIVGQGYNPVVFPALMQAQEKIQVARLFAAFGTCPEVAENTLEAYAVITAMGPTYLWFQLYELEAQARAFGMADKEAREAVRQMAEGVLATMNESGLPPEKVMDLVPVKPLGADEAAILASYREKLPGLYAKLKT